LFHACCLAVEFRFLFWSLRSVMCFLSLHDALPIVFSSMGNPESKIADPPASEASESTSAEPSPSGSEVSVADDSITVDDADFARSEEHTSELQSRFDIVCSLLLEKKKEDIRVIQNK